MNKVAIPVSSVKQADNNSINVIFKGLDRCNAGCSFCCIGDSGGTVISWDDFSNMAKQLEDLVADRAIRHITFTFHGGEPTLLKADLLDRMCERICQIPADVVFNMQSNLFALPVSLKKVVIKNKIKIGTSVDPLGVDRLTQNDKSGFPVWLRTFVAFSRESDPPGAIYVITRHSLGKEQVIYDMCETIGGLIGQRFALQLNPVYAQGKASEQEDDLSITPDEYGTFMINFWRLWEQNRRSISITPIQSFARYFLPDPRDKTPHLACTYNGNCPGSHVGIDYKLNVAGCGRRLDSDAFIGNLHVDTLVNILQQNKERNLLSNRIPALKISDCKDCSFFAICHGGCPDDAWLGTGDVKAKTYWCDAHKLLFNSMEKEIRNIRRPASVPPAIPKNENDFINIIVAENCEQLPDKLESRSEIWMLPDKDGNWLKFDSQLSQIKSSFGTTRIRLWCHNNQVASLMMWEDLLRSKEVSVVLFEAIELPRAMNILNSLNALIILDVVSIVKEEKGSEILGDVLQRYLSDSLWSSQVLPFSQMIKSYINREPIRLFNEFGLISGFYNVVRANDMLSLSSTVSQDIVERLEMHADADRVDWFLERQACTRCEHYRFCGMRFSQGDNEPCDGRIKSIVAQVHEAAVAMQDYLHEVSRN